MALKIPRSRLRSIYKSPYLVYPAGILAIVLVYTLIFLLLQDNFHLPDGRSDFLTALYWVVITMTTTGYGDIYPTTELGKMFSLLVVLTGLFILFALVLPLMVTPIMDRLMRRPRSRVPDWVSGHVIIAGYNAIVETLIIELAERDIPFVVIDRSPEDIRKLQRHGHEAIQGDATDEDVLANAGIGRASYLIANEGDDQNAATVLTASQVSDCKIIALVDRLDMAHYLEYAGADFVVSPKQILGMNIGLTAVSSINFELSNAVDLGGNVKMLPAARLPGQPHGGEEAEGRRHPREHGRQRGGGFQERRLHREPGAGDRHRRGHCAGPDGHRRSRSRAPGPSARARRPAAAATASSPASGTSGRRWPSGSTTGGSRIRSSTGSPMT